MFSHVMVGTNDIEESRIFYDKIFEVLGAGPGKMYPNLTGQKRYFYNLNGTSFCISEPIDGNLPQYQMVQPLDLILKVLSRVMNGIRQELKMEVFQLKMLLV